MATVHLYVSSNSPCMANISEHLHIDVTCAPELLSLGVHGCFAHEKPIIECLFSMPWS